MGASRNKSRSSTTPQDFTPGVFQRLQQPFAEALQNVFQNGFPTPEGPYSAPITGQEKALTGKIAGTPTSAPTAVRFLDQTLNGTGQVNPLANNPYANSKNPFGSTSNPFLEAMIKSAQRPTMQGLEETLSRALPGRFTQAGHFSQPQGSSAFDRAAAIATRGAADASADIATNLTGAAFESERGRSAEFINAERNRRLQQDVASAGVETEQTAQGLQAAELRQGITSAEISNMTQKLQAVALPRLIDQYGLDKGLELFQSQMDAMLAALGVAAGVTRPVIASSGESKSSGGGVSFK